MGKGGTGRHNQMRQIEEEAASAGFVKMTGRGDNPTAVFWRVTCCRCATHNDNAWDTRTSAGIMIRNMRRKGWYVDSGKPPRCPLHYHNNPIPMGRPEPEARLEKEEMDARVPQDPKLARTVFLALEEHFNVDAGAYRNGRSDDKVAQETGAAVALVISVRENAYGPLKESPEFTQLRDDLTLLKMEKDETDERFNKQFAALAKRLESLSDRQKMSR